MGKSNVSATCKRVLTFFLALLLCIGEFPVTLFADTPAVGTAQTAEIFYIHNHYTGAGDMYLCENNGVLEYGVPKSEDPAYQWTVENVTTTDENGQPVSGKALRNVASGDYINVSGTTLGWNGSVAVTEYDADDEMAFLWDFDTASTTIISRVADANYNLNPQTAIDAQGSYLGSIQCRSDIPTTYGSIRWDFIAKDDFTIPVDITYYLIGNTAESDQFLCDSDTGVACQKPSDATEDRFCWSVETMDGSSYLKNKGTGRYLELTDAGLGMAEQQGDAYAWSFSLDGTTNLLAANHTENCVYLADGSLLFGSTDQTAGNALWKFTAKDVYELEKTDQVILNISNSYRNLYMVEENGKLIYDNALSSEKRAQWILSKNDQGAYAIQNVETGHYLSPDTAADTVICVDEITYAWSKEQAAGGIIFGDVAANQNLEENAAVIRCLHMEDQKGYVENGKLSKSYGTAQWNLIVCDSESQEGRSFAEIPDQTETRISSQGSLAMYENQTHHSVLYSQNAQTGDNWRILSSPQADYYYIQNVKSGRYLGIDSSQSVCMLADNSDESALWQFEKYADSNYQVLIKNAVYSKKYLNIQNKKGYVECELVSTAAETTRWMLESMDPDLSEGISNFFYWNLTTGDGDACTDAELTEEGAAGISIRSKAEGYLSMASAESFPDWTNIQCRNDGVDSWGTSKFDLTAVEGKADTYYIRNHYLTEQYLYDGDGILRYGAKEETELFEWKLTEEENGYLIQNLSTGNYVNTEDCEIAWNGSVKVSSLSKESSPEELGDAAVSVVTDRNLYEASYENQYVEVTDEGVSQTAERAKAADWKVEYVDGKARVSTTDGKYLNVADGTLQVADCESGDYISYRWEKQSDGGHLILSMGDVTVTLQKAESISVYPASDTYTRNDGTDTIFTVYADEKAEYEMTLNYTSEETAAMYVGVDGSDRKTLAFADTDQSEKAKVFTLKLDKGINLITFTKKTGNITMDSLQFLSVNTDYRGATTGYMEYEAEDAQTNADVLAKSNTYRQIASEASGRSAVELKDEGDYLAITLQEATNSLVLRYCIPDAANGGGIEATLNLYADGEKIQALELNSKYSWVYGAYPWTNTPDSTTGHRFFDESSFLLDQTYPAGTVLMLKKDGDNTAVYYDIDLLDTELVDDAAAQPADSLAITDFGAVADDGQDDTAALNACIAQASREGKEVFIPAGVFTFNEESEPIRLAADGLVIRGAGMWHSVLEGKGAGFMVEADNIGLYDFAIRGSEDCRYDATGRTAVEVSMFKGTISNLTLANLWVEHTKAGIWTYYTDAMQVSGCRIRDTYADGMNLSAGSSNCMMEQNSIRNTGDDGIALWSSATYGKLDTNNTIRFNTVGLQWLANSIAVYGGKNNTISDNILHDTVGFGAGVNISSNFVPAGFEGTMTIARNTFRNSSSYNYDYSQEYGSIWFNCVSDIMSGLQTVIADNEITDSAYQGISFTGTQSAGTIQMENNRISACGTWGIEAASGISGTLNEKNTIYSGTMKDTIYNASKNFQVHQSNDSSEVHYQNRKEAAADEADGTENGAEAVFTVNYYGQTLAAAITGTSDTDADYELLGSKKYEDIAGESTVPVIRTYRGYVYYEKQSDTSGVVSEDGSLVLNVYYTRGVYRIAYLKTHNCENDANPVSYIYGQEIALKDLTRSGYRFAGWYSSASYGSDYKMAAITKTTYGDLSLYASFKKQASGEPEVIKVSGVSVSASADSIYTDEKLQMKVSVTPSNADNTAVSWSSSNSSYASVDENGLVTAKAAGAGRKVTITATAKDGSGCTGSCVISVKARKVTKIVLSPSAKTVTAGDQVTVKANVTPSNALDTSVTWKSSNTTYATVSSKGVVTTKNAGAGKKVTITATAKDGSGCRGSSTISIRARKVSKVSVSATSTKIAAGKKVTLTAKVTPSNATNSAVAWKSSNTKYATVNSKGVVTTKKAGAGKSVTITATAKDGSRKKASVKISIQKKAVTGITLKAVQTLKAGKKTTVRATVAPAKDANRTVTFTSSNTKYATVSSKGVVTAKKAGKGKTVKITAQATDGSGKKATIKIKIK